MFRDQNGFQHECNLPNTTLESLSVSRYSHPDGSSIFAAIVQFVYSHDRTESNARHRRSFGDVYVMSFSGKYVRSQTQIVVLFRTKVDEQVTVWLPRGVLICFDGIL